MVNVLITELLYEDKALLYVGSENVIIALGPHFHLSAETTGKLEIWWKQHVFFLMMIQNSNVTLFNIRL